MQNKLYLFFIILLLCGCSKKEYKENKKSFKSENTYIDENVVNEKDLTSLMTEFEDYTDKTDPFYWTLDLQEQKYLLFFQNNKLDEILKFSDFIESLAQYHHDDDVYVYNPVILAFDNFPDSVDFLFNNKPELFLTGHIDFGEYQESPIAHLIKTDNIDGVKYFYEKNIKYDDVSDEQLYGISRVKSLIDFSVSQEMVSLLNYKIESNKNENSEMEQIDFSFDYDNKTDTLINVFDMLKPNPEYKQVIDVVRNILVTKSGYENLLVSNIMLKEPCLYIPNEIPLKNKVIRITKENISVYKGKKSWGDSSDRTIETTYYIFNSDGFMSDYFNVIDTPDLDRILGFTHYSYELKNGIFYFWQEGMFNKNKLLYDYHATITDNNISLKRENGTEIIIEKNRKSMLSGGRYTEILFTDDGMNEICSTRDEGSNEWILLYEKEYSKGIEIKNKTFDYLGNLITSTNVINNGGKYTKVFEKINNGIVTSNTESDIKFQYGKNGEITNLHQYSTVYSYEQDNIIITILDNIDSYLSKLILEYGWE